MVNHGKEMGLGAFLVTVVVLGSDSPFGIMPAISYSGTQLKRRAFLGHLLGYSSV
jgi:hypothetical protein